MLFKGQDRESAQLVEESKVPAAAAAAKQADLSAPKRNFASLLSDEKADDIGYEP